MIEGFAVIFVVVVAVFVWISARAGAAAMKADPVSELERLSQYLAWLEDRWRHAVEHNYDDEMKARIVEELENAHAQIAAIRLQIRGR